MRNQNHAVVFVLAVSHSIVVLFWMPENHSNSFSNGTGPPRSTSPKSGVIVVTKPLIPHLDVSAEGFFFSYPSILVLVVTWTSFEIAFNRPCF
mmetsp:Transcript_8243/g.18764  ORF Transcript_8243/g.18764 Transcript_8243/m.18764 type:complete len:93 (-) Transcript_8243:331-609(-)